MNDGASVVTGLITQAGVSGIFIFFFWRLYIDSNKKISEKDEHIKKLNEQVLDAFQKNTLSNVQLSDSIKQNAENIKQNTEATKTLSERVYEVLVFRGSKNGRN